MLHYTARAFTNRHLICNLRGYRTIDHLLLRGSYEAYVAFGGTLRKPVCRRGRTELDRIEAGGEASPVPLHWKRAPRVQGGQCASC